MTRLSWVLGLLLVIMVQDIVCPPVTQKPPEEARNDEELKFGLEYERYLKEVISVLESDDEFRQKLEQSNVSDIKSGDIAKHLEFVSHGVRSQLDEIKRKEIDRLRQIMRLQSQLEKGMNGIMSPMGNVVGAVAQGLKQVNPMAQLPLVRKENLMGHVDHRNPNTFEVGDLAKLIKQATQDLEDLDKKRRGEFKTYEMEKELEHQQHLKELDDEEKRKNEERQWQEQQAKHRDHPRLQHPGSENQLKEVWQESDGMNKDDFDPKTFFYLHDTDGDGSLNEEEVEALFQKELDKAYDPNAPEDDMMERYEEMNRMREHVFNEVDQDGNKMITLKEFLKSTKGEDYKKDEGWDSLDQQKVYTDEELEAFAREYEVPVDPSFRPPLDRAGGDHQPAAVNQMHQEQQGNRQARPGTMQRPRMQQDQGREYSVGQGKSEGEGRRWQEQVRPEMKQRSNEQDHWGQAGKQPQRQAQGQGHPQRQAVPQAPLPKHPRLPNTL